MLDLRLPIGLMFSLVGALMMVYGLITFRNAELYKCSLGINVNLWWGVVLLVFGALMWFSSRRGSAEPSDADQK
jgi:hypothetical protein